MASVEAVSAATSPAGMDMPAKPAGPAAKCPPLPTYAAVLLVAASAASGVAVSYLAPRYFPGDLSPGYIIAHVPFFFILMLLEYLLSAPARKRFEAASYDVADSFSNLAAGTFQLLFLAVVLNKVALSVGPYIWIHNNYPIFVLPEGAWYCRALALLGVDFWYYWFHRASHEISFMWAAHGVHHQAEFYNLTAALRQSMFQPCFSWAFYLSMAPFIPPSVFLTWSSFNTLYQFWLHTTIVRRLGPFEWVLNTPSHHRVHHDRRTHANYGGTTIIWDRLFRTFVDEGSLREDGTEPVQYGTLSPLESWEPVFAQFVLYFKIWERAWAALCKGKVRSAISTVVMGPGYRPLKTTTYLQPVNERVPRIRHRSHMGTVAKLYLSLHTAICHVLVVLLLVLLNKVSYPMLLALTCVPVLSFSVVGLLLDGNPHAISLEFSRCVLLAIVLLEPSRVVAIVPALASLRTVLVALGAVHAASAVFVLLGSRFLRVRAEVVTRKKVE